MRVIELISFDIDGTLEMGDPPGIITLDMVRRARQLGYLIGSCSDRPISVQSRLWEEQQIAVDFTVLKHRLEDVRSQFSAAVYYHIGDTHADQHYAQRAGFRFIWAEAADVRRHGPDFLQSLLQA
jgi:phosphoglycolate phosphatase-like HAD superfamily hydrolase